MAGSETRPVLDQVNIIGGDLEATLAFYRMLGLEIREERVWRTETGAHHANAEGEGIDLDFDSSRFAPHFNAAWAGHEDLAGRAIIGFRVSASDDVDARYATLTAAGYRGLQPPFDAFWGARYAIVEDPDGLAVGIMGPVEPARRSPPPEV
ncbi:MAG: VOC family protein [Dehalococcoidia bacterium]|nr:VOC family protein [Dehalococcoidia bacterium]